MYNTLEMQHKYRGTFWRYPMKTIEDLFFGNNIPFELPAIDPDEWRHLSELLNRLEHQWN